MDLAHNQAYLLGESQFVIDALGRANEDRYFGSWTSALGAEPVVKAYEVALTR